MGNDDYLDWNGPKRKERDRPSKDRESWIPNKHTRIPGIKQLSDQHKSILKEIKHCIRWNRSHQEGFLSRWGHEHLRTCHKKIRKFVTELRKREMLYKVLKYREENK